MATKNILTDIVSNGSVESTSFVKTGGTSSQFLKADGSVDTNSYLTSASIDTPAIKSDGFSPSLNSNITAQEVRDLIGAGTSSFDGAYSSLSGIPSTFAPSSHTLDSHSNVSISSNTTGEILKWTGTNWINNTLAEAGIASIASVPTNTSDLTNDSGFLSSVTGDWTGTFDGQEGTYYLDYNNLTNVPATFAPAAHTLDAHANVTISSNTSGEILKWNGTSWINNTLSEAGIAAAGDIPTATSDLTNDSGFTTFDGAYGSLTGVPSTFAPSAHTLDSHSNVTITTNSSGEILKWNGTAWVNNTLAEAGIAASGDIPVNISELSNDAGYLTGTTGNWSGTFDGEEGTYYLDYNNFTNTPSSNPGADGTGLANKLTIWTASDTIGYDDNLHWDGANERLGIGNGAPTFSLDVTGQGRFEYDGEAVILDTAGAAADVEMAFYQNSLKKGYAQYDDTNDTIALTSLYGPVVLRTGSTGVEADRITIAEDGDVGIGTSTMDKFFNVAGDTKISGQVTLSDDTADAIIFDNTVMSVYPQISNDTLSDIQFGVAAAQLKDFKIDAAGSVLINDDGVTKVTIATSSGNIDTDGSVTASSFVKDGGTSSQYLMADGSVSGAVDIDIVGLTAETTLASTLDAFLIYDQSSGGNKKIAPINIPLSALNNDQGFIGDSGATLTDVDVDNDEFIVYDNNAGVWKSIDVQDLMRDLPQTPSNSTSVSLINPMGEYYVASANSATTYTTTNADHAGGWALVLINAATEPTVTGGTKIPGADFAASTDMHMIVFYDGAGVKFYFLALS